ncbi:MAG: TIGR02281 family clan AA aspartic protease [Rickettsiales bacterium]
MKRLIAIILLALFVIFLATQFPGALSNEDNQMNLVYLVVLLSAFAVSMNRFSFSQTVKYTVAWLAIIMLLVIGYSYRDVFLNSRIGTELIPARPLLSGDGNVVIKLSQNGHFHINAKVNGKYVNFMIDTGASDVVLNRRDAERVGIPLSSLSFSKIYSTANGITTGAPVKLDSLQLGDFTLNNFPASVNKGDLDSSLLGMSALQALGGFRVDGDIMIIGKNKNKK